MDPEMQGIFDRADELTQDLVREYEACAQRGEVSERARNLFHDVQIKIRSALDFAMNRVFEKHTDLTDKRRARAARRANFPIFEEEPRFEEKLKELGLGHLEQSHPELYAEIRQAQPFESGRDQLLWLQEHSNLGKHVRLAPQDCRLQNATRVTRPNGATAVWTEGSGPVDRNGKPVEPGPDCDVEAITLVTFEVQHASGSVTMPGIQCRGACQAARRYVGELLALL